MRILIFLLIFFPLVARAQDDSTSRALLLKEVQIVRKKPVNGLSVSNTNNIGDLQNIDKMLSEISGVTMIRRGNFAHEPTIRGLSAGQLNSTIDGMQVFGACTDRMDPISSYVEANNMTSIRLHLGSNEEQLASSIGGGFDFSLRKANLQNTDTTQVATSMGAAYESNGKALKTLAAFEISRKRIAFSINGIWRKAANYDAAKRSEVLFSQYEKWNAGASLALAMNERNYISFDYLQDEGRNIGYPALTMDVGFAKAKIASISHHYHNSAKVFYHAENKLYFNYIDHAMDDTKRPTEMVAMHMDMPGTSLTFGYYSKLKLRIAKRHFVQLNPSAYRNYLHAEMTMYPDYGAEMFMLTLPDALRTAGGVSLSDKILVSQRFTLSIGGRAEMLRSEIYTLLGQQTLTSFFTGDPARTNLIWNAFVQGSYSLGGRTNLFAGAARNTRAASLQELYGFYLFNRMDNFDYLGNPELKTEKVITGNVGATYSSKRFEVSGQVFGYFFSDYIVGVQLPSYSNMTIGASGVKSYTNLDAALLYGGEVSLSAQLFKGLVLSSTNSISIGRDDRGDPLPLIPPFRSINKLRYRWKKFEAIVDYITSSGQYAVDFEKYGETFTPPFHLVNIHLQHTLQIGRQTLHSGISVENIFDSNYYEHLDIMKIPRPGRNIILQLMWKF